MTTSKKILLIAILAIVGAALGYFLWGGPGIFAGLVGLIAARAKAEGKREQAEEDRVGAQKQRDDLRPKLDQIDEETEEDVAMIKKKWTQLKGRPPTKKEEAELLARFKVKR